MKRAIVLLVLLIGVALGATAVAGPLEDATSALRRGDYATALSLFRSLADQGNVDAQTKLGYMYETGRGVANDKAQAVEWYRKAAEQGYASGQNALGFMYLNGDGIAPDDAEAVQWFRKAAEQGNAFGENNLGRMYANGRGVAKDDAQAVEWYRKAAEQGNANGENNLGTMYENGRGIAKDDAQAVQWYRKAAEQGNAYGENNLGRMYANGRAVTKDDTEAVKWYRKAAEQGNAFGQTNLGYMYESGRGVPKDDIEAVKWYRKAAEQANVTAQGNLRRILSSQNDATADCLRRIDEWAIRLGHNHLIVDGAINGQKIGVLLDTGAQHTLIVRSAAERLGLKAHWARRYRMFGIGGETDVESALIDEIKIGEATRKDWRMLVAGERDVGDDIGVILGEDFFRLADVEFDLAHNAVRLWQSRPCGRVSLAYWLPDGAREVAIGSVNEIAPDIVLLVSINGQPVRAKLDSGAAMSLLDKAVAARLGMTPETPGVVAQGSTTGLGKDSVTTWVGRFESLAIGSELVRNPAICFADLRGQAQMLLGADFLLTHRVLVAHSQRKVYFTDVGGPMPDSQKTPVDSRTEANEGPKRGEN